MSPLAVGLFYHLSGSQVALHKPLLDAALMAISAINQTGGIEGEMVVPVVVDAALEPLGLAKTMQHLWQVERVATVFSHGFAAAGWARLLPLLEQGNGLVWSSATPCGLPPSPAIFHTGVCVNQVVEPTVKWLQQQHWQRIVLVNGSDRFGQHTAELLRSHLQRHGIELIGQASLSPDPTFSVQPLLAHLHTLQPDGIVTILPPCTSSELAQQPQWLAVYQYPAPILTLGNATMPWQQFADMIAAHHPDSDAPPYPRYISAAYQPNLDNPANHALLKQWHQAQGTAATELTEAIAVTHTQLYLWKQAVELAGTVAVDPVRLAAYGQTSASPLGLVQLTPTHHLTYPGRVSQIHPPTSADQSPRLAVVFEQAVVRPLPWAGSESQSCGTDDPNAVSPAMAALLAERDHWKYRAEQLAEQAAVLDGTLSQLQVQLAERERIATALQDSEARFRLMLEMAPLPIVISRVADGVVVYANGQLGSLLGLNKQDYAGQQVADFYYEPSDRQHLLNQLAAHGCLRQYQIRLKQANGDPLWVVASVQPMVLDGEDVVMSVLWDISDRLRIEADLERNQQYLRMILDNIPQQVFWKDTSLTFLGCNKSWATAIHASSPEFVVGKTDYDLVPNQEMAELFRANDRRVLETGIPELHMIQKKQRGSATGNPIWLDVSRLPIRDAAGNVIGIIGVIDDITARRQAEEALQQSEAENRAILAALPDLMIQLDRDGQYLKFFAPKEFHHCGVDAIGQSIYDVLPPKIAAERMHYAQQAWETGEVQIYEHQIWLDNELRYEEVRIVPINAEQVLMIVRDITRRKRSEAEREQAKAALQEKEEYLRLILDNIPQQVFWKDTNLMFTGCNKNWVAATEVTHAAEVLGKTDYELLGDRDVAEHYRNQDRQVIETNTPQLHMIERKQRPAPDGSIVWLDISKVPIRNPDGAVVGVLGVIEDITQRKLSEDALRLEQEKSEQLLLNILPRSIVQRLKQTQGAIAEAFPEATILFADIVGFTQLSSQIPPQSLVGLLNRIFSRFDQLSERYGLEKIKTIGDAYMVASGIPSPRPDHLDAMAEMALDMLAEISTFRTYEGQSVALRMGMHTGPVIAGVIGQKKFIYDLWGDTVNVASRMESQGEVGKIQVTAEVYQRLQHRYRLESRGAIAVKGKGNMDTYWLLGREKP